MRSLSWLALLLTAAPAWADDRSEPLSAAIGCQPEVGSSRLICSVEYRSTSGGRIVWADALVTSAPPFARPLRARVTAAVERDGAAAQAGIALVPSGRGSGRLTVRARSVLCAAGSSSSAACSPLERELSAELTLP